MDEAQAERDIRLIRQIMERSAHYTNFSGISGVIAGTLALIGCAATYWIAYNLPEARQNVFYLTSWIAILVLAICQDFALGRRKAKKRGEVFFTPATAQVIKSVIPGVFIAFVLSLHFLRLGELDVIPSIWALGYGAAVFAAGMFTVREVRVFGIIQMATGAVGLFFFSQSEASLYLLAVSFGLYHILYGLWMTRNTDGSAMPGPVKLDETIHQSTRLAIMSHLAAVGESDFLTIKSLLGLSDGNISVHTGLLEKSGYIETEKTFVGKKTRTVYRITPSGRRAFLEYVEQLENVLWGKRE